MNLLLNFLLISAFQIYLCSSFIYPIPCEKCSKEDSFSKHVQVEEESELLRDIMNYIVLPINNGICNLWVNFLEVYDCATSQYGSKDSSERNSRDNNLFQRILFLFGMHSKENHVSKCSYYSITIVISSLLLLMAFVYSTKKMVDYFREEDFLEIGCNRFRKGSLNKKLNICNCKINDG